MRALRDSCLFDHDYYREQIGHDVDDPVAHYLNEGSTQGLSPHPLFDRKYYLEHNPTAQRSPADPFVEFVRVGAQRGKKPHPLFDAGSYLEVAPDAVAHPGGPLGHYLSQKAAPLPVPWELRVLGGDSLKPDQFVDAVKKAVERHDEVPDYRDFVRSFSGFDNESARRFMADARHFMESVKYPPMVSVIIPTKDRRYPLELAIQSVRAQTYQNWEIIVVDDGSSDETGAFVQRTMEDETRIRYVYQENTGVAGARNHGIRLSRGEYLAYLDSDNTWVPEFLETMVAFLLREGLRAGYCASELRGADGRVAYRGRELNVDALRERNYIDCITLVHERSLVNEIGAFDDHLRRVVDWDLLIRLSSQTHLGYAPFIGTSYDVWEQDGERITMTESVGYRYVVIDKHRVHWESAPPLVPGRTSIVIGTTVPISSLLTMLVNLLSQGSVCDADLEVIVVDNRGDDEDALMLRLAEQLIECLHVVRLVDSPSVNVARNSGASSATGDVLVFCDGVMPTIDDIRTLRASTINNHALVQPVVGVESGLVVSAGLGLARGGHVIRWGLDQSVLDPLLPSNVDAIESAMVVVEADVVRQLRGFDALFVHGNADADLSLRARRLGVKSMVERDVVVRRAPGVSVRHGSPTADDRREFFRRWGDLGVELPRPGPTSRIAHLRPIGDERGGLPARWNPALARVGNARRWAIKTCVPGLSVAESWGDWHFALALRDALVGLGEEAVVDTVQSGARESCYLDDINLVLRGTQRLPANPSQTNYLWVISHPDRVTAEELGDYDRVFVASRSFAERLRKQGHEHVEPLLQCTDPHRFFPALDETLREPLLFVGNSRRVVRRVIADALSLGYEPAIYGRDWDMVPAELVRAPYLPNEELRRHYSSAGIVLNDHWEDMGKFGFLSNRLFDAVAAGAVVVSDYVEGIEEVFGDRVVTYMERSELRQAIESARRRPRGDSETARRIREEHSFRARAARLVSTADEDAGVPAPSRARTADRLSGADSLAISSGTTVLSDGAPFQAPPVFVGGTGRSGTTIVGRLIASSSAYALVPIEVRFHADPGGLSDLIAGKCSVDDFVVAMTDKWYSRRTNRTGPRGLNVVCAWVDVEAALERFRQAATKDQGLAAAALIHDLLDPVAERAGTSGWVEMTPPVIKAAEELAKILPRARFVHMSRDGRDVAASVARRGWGPNTVEDALRWWADEMIEIHHKTARIDPSRLLHLRLESLVLHSRQEAYSELSCFLGLENDDFMRAFFDDEVSAERAHLGRWKRGLESEAQRKIEALYAQEVDRIRKAGVPWNTRIEV